jgi:hypothetical protein
MFCKPFACSTVKESSRNCYNLAFSLGEVGAMSSRLFPLLLAVLTFAAGATAQQACSAFDVPVSVISAGGESFRNLSADSFVASTGSVVKSLTYDEGPRRVLLVVDTSNKLSGNARKAEAELIDSLVSASRPEDSLALITARGPGGMVKFGEDRAGIARALSPQAGPNRKGGVLDAVVDGLEWFDGSRPGDAVVVIAADLDGNHKTNAKGVAKALATRHVRMFGLALGPVQAGSTVGTTIVTSGQSQGMAQAQALTGAQVIATGDEHFLPLVLDSGGLLLGVLNEQADIPHNMNDPKLQQQVKYKAQQMYKVVSIFYRLHIEAPQTASPQPWSLDVTDSIRKQAPAAMWLLYPHQLGPC